jgi:hypothetical protein
MIGRHQRSDGSYVVLIDGSHELPESLGSVDSARPIGHAPIFAQ